MTTNLYIPTPLIFSDPISRVMGSDVYLKLEALQPSGSFKNRGIGNFCAASAKAGAKEFVCSSGGNAGLAAAYAARKMGIPITVYVPDCTPRFMLAKIEAEGARVVLAGEDWQESDKAARAHCAETGACYVHPFDDPLIWQGHSTMIHEVAATEYKPDAVVLSVGGGGLLCGVLQGMHDVGWKTTPLFAVETEGAASFAAAVKAGKVVTIDKIETVARSLGARAVCEEAFRWTERHPVLSKVVSDAEALRACEQFADDHRLLVEPACGAALALCYERDSALAAFNNILVIVCGGCNVARVKTSQTES